MTTETLPRVATPETASVGDNHFVKLTASAPRGRSRKAPGPPACSGSYLPSLPVPIPAHLKEAASRPRAKTWFARSRPWPEFFTPPLFDSLHPRLAFAHKLERADVGHDPPHHHRVYGRRLPGNDRKQPADDVASEPAVRYDE
jgi:hypothetical protein